MFAVAEKKKLLQDFVQGWSMARKNEAYLWMLFSYKSSFLPGL